MRLSQCDPMQVTITDVRTLILLLSCPEPSVCAAAVDSLTRYSETSVKRRTQLLNLNITRPLVELTLSKEAAVRRAAIACLAATTELNEIHQDMRRRDLMNALIVTLSREDNVEVQDEAAFALANIAKDFSNKADIRKAGGIKVLVNLLDSSDPDVKKNVALALSVLLEDFSNRAEIRYVNGLSPLIELLVCEYTEVQENCLQSLIRCAEDYSNRVEIRKLGGIRRLVDLISIDPSDVQLLALHCLTNCLEEVESATVFADANGIAQLARLIQYEDPKIKYHAALTLAKAAKVDRGQNSAREAGVLPYLVNNMASNDSSVISSSAMALASLGKNESCQVDLYKTNFMDMFSKLLSQEDVEVKREVVDAISSMCLNPKVRAKVRGLDITPAIIKLLGSEDVQTVVNASECLSNMAEDFTNRAEIIKQGGVQAMLSALERPDFKIQSSLCMSLARCLQDSDGQAVLTKQPGNKGLLKLIELLMSKDVSVCRNAAYALSNATQHEPNAIAACNAGALESLISLSKENLKSSTKFAADAMEKLLNHHLSAKYWLRNYLGSESQITDAFYDIGFSGSNFEAVTSFPTLIELQSRPVDKRREIILVDANQDTVFASISTFVSDAIVGKSSYQQLHLISNVVASVMGGAIDPAQLSEYGFKFRITELKLKFASNVIPIGHINQGTFYHRALLFKALCDRVGISPCTLVRGEYNRAWNVVGLTRQTLTPKPVLVVKEKPPVTPKQKHAVGAVSTVGLAAAGSSTTSATTASTAGLNATSANGAPGNAAGAGIVAAAASAFGTTNALNTATSANATGTLTTSIESILASISIADIDSDYTHDEPAVIDLMFEPGHLMPVNSQEAAAYQRMN